MKISKEYRELVKKWGHQAMTGTISDLQNPIFIFSITSTDLLKQVAKGELNITQLALLELEARTQHTFHSGI